MAERAPMLELTYNWDAEDYGQSRNFGHLAFEVEDHLRDVRAPCAKAELRSRGPPRDGRVAFVRSPDGITIEFLQKGRIAAAKARALGLDGQQRHLVIAHRARRREVSMARIAFVQTHPYDADLGGDAAYILAFAHYLAKAGHDVHGLVSDITRGRTSPVYRSAYPIEKFHSWQVRQTLQLGPKTFVGSPIGLIRKLANLTDLGSDIDAWAPREAAWVDKALARLRPDATVLVHDAVHLAPYLDNASARFALVGHIPSRRSGLGPRRGNAPQTIDHDEELLAGSLQKVDGIGFNSRDDIAYASQHLSDGEMLFIGMGYPDAPQSPISADPVVLFVGNATVPNRAALAWFLERVWPGVIAAHPAARFRVLGQIAFSDQAKPATSVEYIGPVPDLAAEYERAQVVVAPLVAGTAGVKIKVAEAISYGRPIVTTSIGVDGEDKHQLDDAAIIADDPDAFARGIVALLSDDALRAEKSAGATQVFAKQFSYAACYGEFTTWLDRAVLRKSRRSRNLAAARRAQSAVSEGPH